MSRTMVHTTTVEEKFMFGSPPLLNGFSYITCRSQGVYNHEQCCSYENQCSESCDVNEETSSLSEHSVSNPQTINKMNNSYGYARNYTSFAPQSKYSYRNSALPLVEGFNQLTLNGSRASHIDDGIKILEQAGIKIQNFHNNNNKNNNELVFKKRKDLRVLKSVLSTERFREVVMRFGDGDEGGREIAESIHKAMKNSNSASVSCLFCTSESMVYENFPVVDGTLFLTPVRLSGACIRFSNTNESNERYMGYVCVRCMEGKSKTLFCSSCATPWNGSFFQIGTLYSYNILFATPCCSQRVSCNICHEPMINIANGEANNLFFSHFSKKVSCPHCQTEDYHYVKPLSTISEL